MVKKGEIIQKVSITKTDNVNDEGWDGYEIYLTVGSEKVYFVTDKSIPELEDQPMGIYEHDENGKYIQIENWEE